MEKGFYPRYTEISNYKIYETSDVELGNLRCGYFADTNCKVQFYADYVSIIDLTNAMKTGKECTEHKFIPESWHLNSVTELKVILMNQNIKTFADLFSAKEIEGFGNEERSKKAVNVFSPFVEVKPITHPAKWTKATVAKAILTGQIFDGFTKGNYTDDFAYDASVNFGKGKQLDLIDVARELMESSSSGIRIYEDNQKNGITEISVDTHSYNYKTLYFDVDCNQLLKEQRNAEKQKALEQQNKQAESQVLTLTEDDVSINEAYQIKYLEENENTGVQETKSKFIFGGCIFYDSECDYEIVEIKPLEIEDVNMYAISDFFDRAYGENFEDDRIIDLGSYQKAVTGYTLKQMLEEGMTFPILQLAEPATIVLAKEFIQKNIDGVIHIFSGEDTKWSESIKRMEIYEQRIDIKTRTQGWSFNDPSMS